MTNVTIPLFRPAQHPKIWPFATLSLLQRLATLLSPSAGGSATSLATTLISLTLRLESQYTLRPILQLITGSGGVGLSYSHSTRPCVDVVEVEVLKTPHRDGLLNQARGWGSDRRCPVLYGETSLFLMLPKSSTPSITLLLNSPMPYEQWLSFYLFLFWCRRLFVHVSSNFHPCFSASFRVLVFTRYFR